MDAKGSFDWRKLGKPDYSQCHALVASLPPEVRQKMSGVSTELLVRVLHLSWTFAWKSGRGSAYCWPMLRTLGGYVRRSARTVERHIQALKDAGLLHTKRRLTATGVFTSNLYTIGNRLAAVLFAQKRKKVVQNQDTTKMAHNDLKREYKADAPPQSMGRVSDFIMKKYASLGLCPPGARPALATDRGN